MSARKRIAAWLRKAADSVSKPDPSEDEPKREGMHKMFVTRSTPPEMPKHSPSPVVPDVRASISGQPDAFVQVPIPGDWGTGWRKRIGPFCGGEGGGTYL